MDKALIERAVVALERIADALEGKAQGGASTQSGGTGNGPPGGP